MKKPPVLKPAAERICLFGVVNGRHVLDEFDNLVGVAPLIVIPGNDLHEGVGQGDAGLGVEMEVRASPIKSEETTASSV